MTIAADPVPMPMADIEHVASVVRFYAPGAVWGDEHVGTIYITWQTPQKVLLGAATGQITRRHFRSMVVQLVALGVDTIEAYRAKGKRVPGGVLMAASEHFNLWHINLQETLAKHPDGALP